MAFVVELGEGLDRFFWRTCERERMGLDLAANEIVGMLCEVLCGKVVGVVGVCVLDAL